jgi:ATP-dependent RNA helicase DDX35
VVAVSDAHERSVGTDLLLGLLKKVQRVRRDLRVVIVATPPTADTFRWAPDVHG